MRHLIVCSEQPIGHLGVVDFVQVPGSRMRPGVGDGTVRPGDHFPSQGELHDQSPWCLTLERPSSYSAGAMGECGRAVEPAPSQTHRTITIAHPRAEGTEDKANAKSVCGTRRLHQSASDETLRNAR
jgi:hypothetical protein